VNELRQQYPLVILLKIAEMARSSFYYQLKLMGTRDKYAGVKNKIQRIFVQHRGRYGYRRITAVIRREGILINHKTVQRLMVVMRLKSLVRVKKYRAYHGEVGRAAPNRLKQKFEATRPNQKWVTDVTEFRVGVEKLYLSPILDLYNGEIVSYEVARSPAFRMIGTMLQKAFMRLGPADRPILHSDQGWQYRMPLYRRTLRQRDVKQSMSRRGNCLDNAVMESFFGTLKAEFYHTNSFRDVDEVASGLRRYIRYYNHERIRLKLGGLSPVEFRSAGASPALRA
jgi:putative transposase